jgi:putative heme-binding domain-containing protein
VFNRTVIVVAISLVFTAWSGHRALAEPPNEADKRKLNTSNVNQGKQLLNAVCSRCHGKDGKGAKGPNLTDKDFIHAATDDEIIEVIANGIPGTGMIGIGPGFEDISRQIVAYIRDEQRKQKGGGGAPMGDLANGKKLFEENKCTNCHWLGNRGGRLGTDLTELTATADYIRESMRDPNTQVDGTHQKVQVIDAGGQAIVGRRMDENSYYVLLMDFDENLHIIDKTQGGVRVYYPSISIMPEFEPQLGAQGIEDITTYLYSLRKVKGQ